MEYTDQDKFDADSSVLVSMKKRKQIIACVFQLDFRSHSIHCLYISGNAYTPYDRCVCAGYDNGDIKLFDLKNMSLRWETNVKNGVSILYINLVDCKSIVNSYMC